MMKYVVCGASVEDVEAGVNAMKMAITNGATCGVGGSTMAEVEKGLDALKQMVDGCPAPYSETNSRSISGKELRKMIEEAYSEDAEDEDEQLNYCEGYMAMSDDYGEMSCRWDSPEDAMSDALNEGYDLDEIGIYKVRVYEDESVEVVDTIYRPIK